MVEISTLSINSSRAVKWVNGLIDISITSFYTMKSQLSNGTIFHHEITFMLLYCSVLSWGNSLCSLSGGLMACNRAIHILWLTKIILNTRTRITCLSLLSILPLHLLPFVVALIFLKALYRRCGFLLFASYSAFYPAGLWKVALLLNMETVPSGWEKAKTFDL